MPTLKERFEAKIRITPGCWWWEGSRDRSARGYGHFRVGDKIVKAHRVSYELYVGPIPKALLLRHRCDNRYCVNPEHLVVGTDQDNMDDRQERGRTARGEQNGKTKLSNAEVAEMKRLRESGVPKETVAEMFGVSSRTVWYAIKTRNLE